MSVACVRQNRDSAVVDQLLSTPPMRFDIERGGFKTPTCHTNRYPNIQSVACSLAHPRQGIQMPDRKPQDYDTFTTLTQHLPRCHHRDTVERHSSDPCDTS